MKFFLDTANLAEIKEAAKYGLLEGVTTNPSLMAKEGVSDQAKHIQAICRLVQGPVSAEVLSLDAEGMVNEGMALRKLGENVVIKIPMTLEGLKATKALAMRNIKVNVTLVFSAVQALMAANAEAAYVSPFVGRLDDIGVDGIGMVEDIKAIYDLHGLQTSIIVASVRSPKHVLEAAKKGAHFCTVPFSVIRQLVSHPLTEKGLANFLADHAKVKGKK